MRILGFRVPGTGTKSREMPDWGSGGGPTIPGESGEMGRVLYAYENNIPFDLTGLSPQTVSRCLQALKQRGKIQEEYL